MGGTSAKSATQAKQPIQSIQKENMAPEVPAAKEKPADPYDSIPDILCDDEIERIDYVPGEETDIPQYTTASIDLTAEWIYQDGNCDVFLDPETTKIVEQAFLLGSLQITGKMSGGTFIVVFADSTIRIRNKSYVLLRKEQESEKVFWIAEDSTERPLPRGLQQLVLTQSEPVLVGFNDIAYKVDMESMTLQNMHNDMVMPLINKSE